MAGRLAAPRRHLRRPHDTPGRRHPQQRAAALRQGEAACPPRPARGAGRDRARHHGRRGVRLSPVRPGGGRGPRGLRYPGRRRLGGLPRRPQSLPATARGDPGVGGCGRAGDRRRDHAGTRPRGRLGGAVPRGEGVPRGVRRRPSEGDPRHGRPRHAHERGAREPRRHDGGRRLHQDIHRQGSRERHPARRRRDDAPDPGVPRGDGPRRRIQAGGWDPQRQGGAGVAHPHEGRAGRRVAPRRTVPAGGERPAHRHRAPARALRHRSLLGRAPPPDGMTTVSEIFQTMAYGPAPESDKQAREWLAKHGGEFGVFVGGRWTATQRAELFDVLNPATATRLARVTQAGPAAADAAVAAPRHAFGSWSTLSGHARARHLYALARAVQKHARLLAVLESLDNGKSIRETRDIDIPLVARHFYHHAGWAQLLETEFAGYGPAGVVGQIIPWNFPLLMVAWKVAPALAAGCTIVLKPAEFTPLTALAFAELAHAAGLPPGVLNVITGDGETGKLLVEHPDVDKIAFTGSTEVGRHIRQATAGTGKKLSLELGGKSPFIVFEDADLDSVVEGVVDAIWFNQGQVCCAGSRLLVQEGVAAPLIGKLRARMEKLRVGSPLDKAVDMGAIVAPVQLERIRGLVEKGVEEGAKMWQPSWACPTEGYFYPPTLFTDVSPAATIAQIEIFGPVLVSMTFRTPKEAVALANNTPFGLAASVWTENINLALDIAPRIKAGG